MSFRLSEKSKRPQVKVGFLDIGVEFGFLAIGTAIADSLQSLSSAELAGSKRGRYFDKELLMVIRSTLCILSAASAMLGLMPTAQAQIYVPHTTTHFDAVPHHGHIDIVPHTTTHYDALPFPSHGAHYGGGYGSGYGANYGGVYSRPYNEGLHRLHYGSVNPNRHRHGNTHLDIVPHRGHLHVVPHTTSRRHHH